MIMPKYDMLSIVVRARIDRPDPVGYSMAQLVLPVSRHYAEKLERLPAESDKRKTRLDVWVERQVQHRLGAQWGVHEYWKGTH